VALGYAPEEMVGQEAHALFHHSYPDGTQFPREACAIWRASVEGRPVHVHDDVLWRRDGTSFPAAYASSPLHRDGGLAGAVRGKRWETAKA
jgi:PAS domain-containing protein